MSIFDPAYDGRTRRWRVRCGFVCEGVQCSVEGEFAYNPEAPTPKKHKIFCMDHAREDGRLGNGRNKHLRTYVMCMSQEDKERARKLVKDDRTAIRRTANSTDNIRTQRVKEWLGTDDFKELDPHRTSAVLDQLRIPPPLLGTKTNRARIYLLDTCPLADLEYLYKARPSDGRRLYLVRGSSIIR